MPSHDKIITNKAIADQFKGSINIEYIELLKILSTHLGFEVLDIFVQVEGGNIGFLPRCERILAIPNRITLL